ncbi:hypothetical protein DLAC_07865 [Tieghemostelium lacteum]|uniref:Uncharacterized protein n=1 Tax=Tieghemostelium lacteum TaxID=361077 RepID=A0A151ZAK7_TIELA|nr:hypothetical protein DLAC_07865 [Tieghemostelium lacteum]|eukprot:KYQ90977.1 hypothetical protein DLAC_07865 [Tieghemostelium lacteum]
MKLISFILILLQLSFIFSDPLPLFINTFYGVNISLVDTTTGSVKPVYEDSSFTNSQFEFNRIYYINSTTYLGAGAYSELNFSYKNIDMNYNNIISIDFNWEDPLMNSFFNPNTNQIYTYNNTQVYSSDPFTFERTGLNINLPSIFKYTYEVGVIEVMLDSTENILYFYLLVPEIPDVKVDYNEGFYPCVYGIGCKYFISYSMDTGNMINSIDLHVWSTTFFMILPISSTSIIGATQDTNSYQLTFVNFNPTNGELKTLTTTEGPCQFVFSTAGDNINQIVYLLVSGNILVSYDVKSNQINNVTLPSTAGQIIQVGSW